MLSVYPACFFKEENGYSVIFPDLNWLSTCGDSVENAMEMAVDCLAGYLYECKRENENVPQATAIGNVDIDSIAKELDLSSQEGFVNMITVDVEEYAKKNFEKAVKKTLTIPAWLNKAAIEKNINFSQVLKEALIQKISCP